MDVIHSNSPLSVVKRDGTTVFFDNVLKTRSYKWGRSVRWN